MPWRALAAEQCGGVAAAVRNQPLLSWTTTQYTLGQISRLADTTLPNRCRLALSLDAIRGSHHSGEGMGEPCGHGAGPSTENADVPIRFSQFSPQARKRSAMTAALAAPIPDVRRSVPVPGTSLVAATEAYAVHVRAAVDVVRRSFGDDESASAAWTDMLASRWRQEPLAISATPSLQAAWGLVAMRIVGRSVGALCAHASLRDAEVWFLGWLCAPRLLSDAVSELAGREAIRALEAIEYDDTLRDLLPYVLDAHGPGSRASVMKAPGTRKARHAKRAGGVFYTPSDVAEYITRETMRALDPEVETPAILDPACGSGVFLKAALHFALARNPNQDPFKFVERSLYGIDVNPLAVDAACFVLLRECLDSAHRRQGVAPWSLWHRIRCNLCVGDALTFELTAANDHGAAALASLRTALDAVWLPPSRGCLDRETTVPLFSQGEPIGSVFPALARGADAIIGNPPYAAMGSRADAASLQQRFASLRGRDVAGANCFPAFLEMTWKLARPDRCSSGMVVPLSLACSGRAQMAAIRRAIMASGGRWRFAFFDREPHALFGEEVKTRNTIAFRCMGADGADEADEANGRSAATTMETGPLRKWTSRQRAGLFETIDFTPLNGCSISAGIPKLSGKEFVAVFEQLAHRPASLREMCVAVASCLPADAAREHRDHRVFVSGTAYNFLNVFRRHRNLPPSRAPWSTSKVLALHFATESEAARAFALPGSRVAYWLWHATGDGFHVTRAFVLGLPFSDRLFNEAQRDNLARLGTRLWDDLQKGQIVSVNGGRQTIAYRPHASESLRDEIDALLLAALGAAPSFIDSLRRFTRDVVAVDENDETRRRFTSAFTD